MANWSLRELYHQLTSDDGRWRELAVPRAAVRWAVVFYRELQRDKAFIRAGGMAYITLIALVPLLLLIFGVLHATGLLAANQATFEQLVFDTFLGDIPGVKDFLLPGLMQVDLRALGILGVLGLVFVSARLYLTIEIAYNDIFGAAVDRPFSQRVLNFYFVLTAMPVAFGVALVGTRDWVGSGSFTRWMMPAVTFGILLSALKLFPCTQVRWRAALAGAAVSAVLLELGGRLFPLYITLFASDDPLRIVYGSLGLIPVFLLWLFMLWVFVLLGVEVAYVVQHFSSLSEAEFEVSDADARLLSAPTVGLALEVLTLIGAAFEAGQGPVSLGKLSERTGVSLKVLHGVLRVHEQGEFALRSEDAWTLARPPERIPLREVIAAWRHHTSIRRVDGDVVGEAIDKALAETFDGTLADAISWWNAEQAPEQTPERTGPQPVPDPDDDAKAAG